MMMIEHTYKRFNVMEMKKKRKNQFENVQKENGKKNFQEIQF